jgi:hypothetical protein
MSDINITFINKSQDANNSRVVIFQKNTAPSYNDIAVAWKVIENIGMNNMHPFSYSTDYYISAGNTGMQIAVEKNSLYEVLDENSTAILMQHPDKGDNKNGYTFINNLPFEIVSADVYSNGTIIASSQFVEPQQKVEFEFDPLKLYIAEVNFDVYEGGQLPAEFLSDTGNYTEVSLEGIEETAIVCTRDENGHATFTLEDIATAVPETATSEE